MIRSVSLALHDLKISDSNAVDILEQVRKYFGVPFAVHLVCDSSLSVNPSLEMYIRKHVLSGELEVVYHGVHHVCEYKAWRLLAWYHNYQAEYIINSQELRRDTASGYAELASVLRENPGICPPCWIASSANRKFLDSLKPLYREKLLSLIKNGKGFFSPVLSLGSPRPQDLIFLKPVACFSYAVAVVTGMKRVRIAVHICDLTTAGSLPFFKKHLEKFKACGYVPVLQKELSTD